MYIDRERQAYIDYMDYMYCVPFIKIIVDVSGVNTMMKKRFRDRMEAGQLLAAELTAYAYRPDVLVLALPRGGIPVAYAIAKELDVQLDILVVRKLGVPGHEELAMGAIATGGVRVLNTQVIEALDIPAEVIDSVAAREQRELERRERLYRGDLPPYIVRGRTIILVDDGIATGATMHAAVSALKQQQPARLVIAVPVAAASTCEELAAEVDEVVCLLKPIDLFAVGYWYEHFPQMTDEEVFDLLARAIREGLMGPQKQPGTPAAAARRKMSRQPRQYRTKAANSINV